MAKPGTGIKHGQGRSPDEQQRLGCEVQNLWAAVTHEGEQCWQSTGLHDRCLGSLRIGKCSKGGDSVQLQLRRVRARERVVATPVCST